MRFQTLDEWLRWQETLHPRKIDLGLQRVATVFQEIHRSSPPLTVITVAGTNGKGSSVAMLEAILAAAGYRVGSYTSPHIHRYNERIRIAGAYVDDRSLCEAFQRIDDARGSTSLTYFEFGTLAALDLFYRAELDVLLLEAGLGGRLDAVNVVDADLALITSIDIDHTEWLGEDRNTIAREKAGIFRRGKPAVCSDPQPPPALQASAEALQAHFYQRGNEFAIVHHLEHWDWRSSVAGITPRNALPLPALRGEHQLDNAAGVLMALGLLAERLPVSQSEIRQGLLAVSLAGRFQVVPGEVSWVCDVAHNPQSARVLADTLRGLPTLPTLPGSGEMHAVVGLQADKDLAGVLTPLLPLISHWHLANLPSPRGATAVQIQAVLEELGTRASMHTYGSVAKACEAADAMARPGERVLVFGSFQTLEHCPACA